MSGENSPAAGTTCSQHPGAAAPFVCARCQQAVCIDCCYSMPDGSVCCKTCYQNQSVAAAPVATAAPVTTSLRLASEPAADKSSAAPQTYGGFRGHVTGGMGLRCYQHPHLAAVARCKLCGTGSCHTCDFVFPPNLHYCPSCIALSAGKITPRRKKYLIWSCALAAFAMLGFVGSMVIGAMGLAGDEMADTLLGIVLIVLAGFPTVIGTALAMSAWRSGGPNSIGVWIALIWNSLQCAGLLLLMIAGAFMG